MVVAGLVASVESGSVEYFAEIAVIYLGLQAVLTLLPITYPASLGAYGGCKSDGRVALELLLGWSSAPNEDLGPTPAED